MVVTCACSHVAMVGPSVFFPSIRSLKDKAAVTQSHSWMDDIPFAWIVMWWPTMIDLMGSLSSSGYHMSNGSLQLRLAPEKSIKLNIDTITYPKS